MMKSKLKTLTNFFGIPLWILLLSSISSLIFITCIITCLCFIYHSRRKNSYKFKPKFSLPKSIACKPYSCANFSSSSLDRRLLLSAPSNISEIGMNFDMLAYNYELGLNGISRKDVYFKDLESSGEFCSFRVKEIEDATNGFDKENVIGSGENGIVYLGLLENNQRVAVKRLICDSGQPVEYFASQMKAIGNVKHKKLVKLIGYCAQGPHRMSVSEYVENGNLHYWLHEFPGQVSPLSWTIRLNIIHGVAKGLAYLHEQVKPMILHGNIKSSNILLDSKFNPKVSDFGLVKVLSPQWNHIIIEALGFADPDSHSTNTFTKDNDIYGFGLLIMEIISGKIPLHQNHSQDFITDWFKSMISKGKIADVVDPKLHEIPPSKELKRIVLVAFRCVDPDVNPRIKMGDVVHMLKTNMVLLHEHQIAREACEQNDDSPES